jgi:hypothetical protein
VRALGSGRAELVIVYGRHGVGKSELLVRAMEGHDGLYYQATAEVMAQQLADIAAELQRTAQPPDRGRGGRAPCSRGRVST